VTPSYEASNTVAFLADANNVHELASYELTTGTVSGYARYALT